MPERESLDYHPSSPPDYNSEANAHNKYQQGGSHFPPAKSDVLGRHGAPMTQLQQMESCYCRPIKLQRMAIESNIVTLSLKPTVPRTYGGNSNLYATRTLGNTQQSRTPKKEEGPKRDSNKTPTFLKNMIRDKSVKNIKSSELLPGGESRTPERKDSGWDCKSHSGPFHGAKNPTSSLKRTHTINVDQAEHRNPEGQGGTATNTSRLVEAQWKNKSQIYRPKDVAPACPQQQVQQYQPGGNQRAPVKFYAPVHIIAPTYYVNQGSNNNSNPSGLYKPQ